MSQSPPSSPTQPLQSSPSQSLPSSSTHCAMSTSDYPKPEDNPHHPASQYFIQPGENASSPSVPELLTIENYVTLARSMRRALNIKNKFEFLDGKISKPLDSDPLFLPWERCNDMIIVWLQNYVGLDLRSTIAHAETGADVWIDLCYCDEFDVYEPMPLMEYHHRHKVMQFLVGLQDSYDAIRAQILLSDQLPSFNRVFSLIQQEERRQHSLERCFKANLNLPICSHCRIPGHTKDKCYRLNSYPPGHKNGPKSKSVANIVSLEQEQIHNSSPITQEQYGKLLALLQPSSTIDNTPAAANQV
ncbi:uncharacterized protein LOC118344255 [Juglans regia]|uniref:Uncharacterized protein LOC118344255 n=1 Tax=Juglans regia TaxID=51240 RepID=A0A6P9DYW7_JUGRE|nr:uncharacterized protein LOC118344255 [Juglans regia]